MKKILIAITLFISAFSLNAQVAEPIIDFDSVSPVFKFDTEIIDYGTIKKGADGNRIFNFTNVGNSPLIITSAKGSCGCTVPTYDNEPIMPGDSGVIKVKFATNRVGRFSKTITLTSNASEPKKVIRIKGIVLKAEEKTAE